MMCYINKALEITNNDHDALWLLLKQLRTGLGLGQSN